MAQDDLIIGFQADTNKFQMDVEKAFKVVTNFADKSGDAGKSIEQSFKKLSQAAFNSGGEIQKAFNSLNISSDFTMKLQQNQLQRAKQFFQSQFDAIAKDANTSAADAMRAFEAFKNIEAKLNLQTPQGKAASESNAKVIAEREATEARMIEINKLRAASVNAEVQKMLAAEKASAQKVIAEREATAQINILHEQALRMDVERNAAMIIGREQALRKMTLAHREAAKINQMFDKGLVDGAGEAIKGIDGMTHGISGFSLASVAAIAKVQIMYSIINNIMSALGSMPGVAVDAIENYKSSIVSNAAMITSMQVGVRDIGAAYRENKIYAEAVQNVLIKMDAETAASGKNLIDMNNQFMQQGVLLDTNNKKQVDGFKNIANALAAITANDPNKDMQYAQEVRSMRDFSDRPGNRLVQYLKSQGVTKEMVEDWKKIGESTSNYGYLLEQLNPYFKGFAAAQGDINDLWETGKSTLVTIRDDILRGGLSEGFSHIITLLKELNKWAENNKFKIQAMIKDGFSQIETTAKILWNMRGTFVALGETALYASIVVGIGSVIIKIQELATAIGTMNTAAKAGILVRVLTNPVAAIGALTIGTAALAINDSMDRSKAEAEANKIGAFTKQDILPGHVAEIRKKYGPISAQEIMGKFANSEIQLETVLSDSYDYIGQRVVFNEAAIKVSKVPYPKNIKSASMGSETEAADYTDRWNSYVDALQSFENKGEGNSYVGQVKKIDEQLQNLKVTYGSLDAAHKKLTDGLHEGGAIKYFEGLAKVAKDTAWYLNVQREATEGLNQAASDKAIFNIANMNGDLSTKRYKVTNPYNQVNPLLNVDRSFQSLGYSLRSNNDYQISQKGLPQKDELAKIKQDFENQRELLANEQIKNQTTGMFTTPDKFKGLELATSGESIAVRERLAELESLGELNEREEKEYWAKTEKLKLIDEKYQADKKKLTLASGVEAISMINNNIATIGNNLMKGNKKQFEDGKALAIASAGVSTALGAIQAWTALSGIPIVGPAMGAIAAATITAAGIQSIGMIQSQQYEAREFGGPVVAGQSYIVGEKRPELFTPGASGVITPYVPQGGGDTNNVTQVIQVSTGVADTVRAEIGRMLPLLRAQAVAAVQQAQRSGQMQQA